MSLLILVIFLLFSNRFSKVHVINADTDSPVNPPTICEVCKLFYHEFMLRYNATESAEMLDYHGTSNKKIPYAKSELRLTEILEDPSLCSSMMQYRLHNERKDSTRFQKFRPQTFETLRRLVDRGVDIKMDIPQSLWDSPSLEISMLKEKCEKLHSEYAQEIEDWFFNHQNETSLLDYLCRNQVLKDLSTECLDEPMPSDLTMTENTSEKVKNEL